MPKLKRRLGMLDSGLGGLTVLGALRAMIGSTETVYFADTAHVPYGDRRLSEVAGLGASIVKRLLEHEPCAIVVASGTTCAAFDSAGWPESPVPLIGVAGPGAAAACAATRNGVIGVVATNATVKSGIFERKILEIRPDAVVRSVGAPALVPIVESGGWASVRARDAVAGYCAALVRGGCDTVVLGCTHFPHLTAWFGAALGPDVQIVDPGASCAQETARILAAKEPTAARLRFEVSGDPEEFAANATMLSGVRIDEIVRVKI
jgi:glutamate racemase